MIVVAFFIGATALNAAQKYWMPAMQSRIDDASSRTDWLPPAQPVIVDTSQMGKFSPGFVPATRP
jgi:hypothetical protein